MDRRSFISGALAGTFAAAAGGRVAAATRPTGPVRLRLGVLSDIHVAEKDDDGLRRFEKALRAFDAWKADGVLTCGDLADWGLDVELEWVAQTWFKVFPDGRRSDGEPVANLLHFGDHDTSGYTYRGCPPCAKAWPDEAEMKKHIIPLQDRKVLWERCFREPWAPIVRKTVRGYDFILSHFTKGEPGNEYGNNVPGLEAFLASAKLDPNRPFFYSQHRIPRNTAGGPYVWGQDDGRTTALFSKSYPNCFVFCGHDHLCASEERAIWQGAFTCVEVPSLLYSVTQAGRENGFSCNDQPDRKPYPSMPIASCGIRSQGLFVTVYDNAVVLRRWSFIDEENVGPDWVVPLPLLSERPYDPAARAAREAAPVFPAGAKVAAVKEDGVNRRGEKQPFVVVRFPLAAATEKTPRANDYQIETVYVRDDVERVVDARRVYSPDYGRGLSHDRGPVVCRVPASVLPEAGRTLFRVRPVNSFGRMGEAIETEYRP